jgi:predicted  nucleic acid-binding Zn-ribbon protein
MMADITEDELEILEKEKEELEDEVRDLKDRVKELEDELEDAENMASEKLDLEECSDSEIDAEFYARNSVDGTMVNEIKIELFFKHIEDFKLEDFEEFIKAKSL